MIGYMIGSFLPIRFKYRELLACCKHYLGAQRESHFMPLGKADFFAGIYFGVFVSLSSECVRVLFLIKIILPMLYSVIIRLVAGQITTKIIM